MYYVRHGITVLFSLITISIVMIFSVGIHFIAERICYKYIVCTLHVLFALCISRRINRDFRVTNVIETEDRPKKKLRMTTTPADQSGQRREMGGVYSASSVCLWSRGLSAQGAELQ